MAEVVVLSGGVGGARFVRGLVDLVGPQRGDGHRERRRRRRVVRAARLARPRHRSSTRSPTVHDEQRGWGGAGETWNALDTAEDARRRRDVVPARRPRPRPPPRADEGAEGGRAAVGRDRADRRGASTSRCRCCPRPTTGCARSSRRRRATFSLQEWFVGRRHKDKVDGLRFEGAALREAGAGRARRDRAGVARRDRAEQPVHLDLADPRGRRDPRHGPAEAHARGRRQPRSSAARRSRARPTR